MRKCVGCGESKPKNELIRIACHDGKVVVDVTGRAEGRGIYLCRKSAGCIEKTKKKKAINRAFKINPGEDELISLLEEIANCKE